MRQVQAEEGELFAGADEERGRADDDVLRMHGVRESVEGEFFSFGSAKPVKAPTTDEEVQFC